jgi:hypothetical protein
MRSPPAGREEEHCQIIDALTAHTRAQLHCHLLSVTTELADDLKEVAKRAGIGVQAVCEL